VLEEDDGVLEEMALTPLFVMAARVDIVSDAAVSAWTRITA
jgi:hypothetical protein